MRWALKPKEQKERNVASRLMIYVGLGKLLTLMPEGLENANSKPTCIIHHYTVDVLSSFIVHFDFEMCFAPQRRALF